MPAAYNDSARFSEKKSSYHDEQDMPDCARTAARARNPGRRLSLRMTTDLNTTFSSYNLPSLPSHLFSVAQSVSTHRAEAVAYGDDEKEVSNGQRRGWAKLCLKYCIRHFKQLCKTVTLA